MLLARYHTKQAHVRSQGGERYDAWKPKRLQNRPLITLTLLDIVCTVCGFRTHTKPKMERHMKSHTGERNYSCKICGKRFLYSYNVTAHVKHVHNREKRKVDEEKLTCKFCGKKFQKIWKVKEHMQKVHALVEGVNLDSSIEEDRTSENHEEFQCWNVTIFYWEAWWVKMISNLNAPPKITHFLTWAGIPSSYLLISRKFCIVPTS